MTDSADIAGEGEGEGVGRLPSFPLGSEAARLSFAIARDLTSAGVGGDVGLEAGFES